MWRAKKDVLKENELIKFVIYENDVPLKRRDVIKRWKENQSFRQFYNQLLVDVEFGAFYWENPSITIHELDETYEFVVMRSTSLEKVSPEPHAFRAHFKNGSMTVVFPNLRKDAILIVPTPMGETESYSHIGNFVRRAPKEQVDHFWKTVGETYEENIGQNRKWLSTAGLGVYWLHLRIDSRPKYYKYHGYR
ncbi:hypothetical protein POV27_12850 [Aureisphaera galaxeae]|uniref:DUF6940 family protein n=1 Tax=Aureisphaera galaxeae TaxID=1538023 RepID=UPI002350C4A3|nr:hypothetical protein [Aureisphaera galaxeae]MDC8004943.1 hypothetical protein [Aureisphaera galaxeae]